METNMSAPVTDGYYWLYKYINILTDTQIIRLSHIATGMLSPSDFTAEEISDLERKINESEPVMH